MKQAEKQIIVDAYARLGTYKRVQEELGYCYTTIWKVLKEFGVGKGTGGNQDSQRKVTDEQILNAIAEGLTRQEIADRHGVHVENLAKRMKKLGVHAVYAVPKNKKHAKEWHWMQGCADFVKRCQNGCFELVEFKGNRVRIRCRKCGGIIERSRSTIRVKNVTCDWCKRKEDEQKAREQLIKTLSKIAELKKPKKCPVCGTIFHSQIPSQRYCSKACKNKNRNSGSIRKRCKKYGAKYESGITLRKVCLRDGGICQICGKPIDWNDNEWHEHFGPNYPTIDHIIPLAQGGNHTWDNVQLAHAMCNSCKRDLITA